MQDTAKKCYAIYDLSLCPATFDFYKFIRIAREVYFEEYDTCQPIVAIVAADSEDGFRSDHPCDDTTRKQLRLSTILEPLTQIFFPESEFAYFKSRPAIDATAIFFPEGYTMQRPIACYSDGFFWQEITRRWPLTALPPAGSSAARDWLLNHGLRPDNTITITLRNSPIQPERNSSLPDWQAFAKYLSHQGRDVVIIPDAYDQDECLDWAGTVCPLAAADLKFRWALMNTAKLNCFVNNGPASMLWAVPGIDYLCWKILVPESTSANADFHAAHNRYFGDNVPYAEQRQKQVWLTDRIDHLIQAYEHYCTDGSRDSSYFYQLLLDYSDQPSDALAIAILNRLHVVDDKGLVHALLKAIAHKNPNIYKSLLCIPLRLQPAYKMRDAAMLLEAIKAIDRAKIDLQSHASNDDALDSLYYGLRQNPTPPAATRNAAQLWIYGTGQGGRTIGAFWQQHILTPELRGYLVSAANQAEQSLNGLPICAMDHRILGPYDHILIVSNFAFEILQTLSAHAIHCRQISIFPVDYYFNKETADAAKLLGWFKTNTDFPDFAQKYE